MSCSIFLETLPSSSPLAYRYSSTLPPDRTFLIVVMAWSGTASKANSRTRAPRFWKSRVRSSPCFSLVRQRSHVPQCLPKLGVSSKNSSSPALRHPVVSMAYSLSAFRLLIVAALASGPNLPR